MKPLVIAALGAVFASGLLPAQGLKVKAVIPFDFHACDRVMPAGEYAIEGEAGVLVLHEQSTHPQSCVALVAAFVIPSNPHDSNLTFIRYGNDYYLKRFWNGATGTGKELPVSPAEKEQIARNKVKGTPETTILSLKKL